MWKWLAKLVFGKIVKAVDALTDADLQKAADYVNKKIGGDRKVEYTSIKIIVEVVQALLDKITL
jgi:hypothetical protein